MASQCTYYFEVPKNYHDGIDGFKAGVYSAEGYMGGFMGWQSRLSWNSSRVWCQGPRGGVKIVKDRQTYPAGVYGYVTGNKKLMREFAWIKLRAKALRLK